MITQDQSFDTLLQELYTYKQDIWKNCSLCIKNRYSDNYFIAVLFCYGYFLYLYVKGILRESVNDVLFIF